MQKQHSTPPLTDEIVAQLCPGLQIWHHSHKHKLTRVSNLS